MKTCVVMLQTTLLFLALLNTVHCYDTDEVDYEEGDYEDDDLPPIVKSIPKPKPLKRVIYNIDDAAQLYEKFLDDYKKSYADEDSLKQHFEAFVKTLKHINSVNSDRTKTYTADINFMADFLPSESLAFG